MTTHGKGYEDKTYRAWKGMKARCLYPSAYAYPWYGGRGIKIDPTWINFFVTFRRDIGECPAGFSLERIDSNGDYKPSNCKWIPLAEQARNTKRTRMLSAYGKTLRISEWSVALDMYHGQISELLKHGWTMEQIVDRRDDRTAFTRAVDEKRIRPICRNGHRMNSDQVNSRGHRVCRHCAAERAQRYKKRQAEVADMAKNKDREGV